MWMRGRRREMALGLAATALVPALLLASEAGLRIAARLHPPTLSWDDMSVVYRFSPSYGWEPRPGLAVVIGGKRVTVNRLGYRGREYPAVKRTGRTRVVMLGDSITFGFRLDDQETFSSLLDGGELEVVNLAVEGYGTGQELLKLQREGLGFHPDVVVLNVCLENDALDNWLPGNRFHVGYPQPYFRIEGGQLVLHDEPLRLGVGERLATRLREHSLLFDALVVGTGAPRIGARQARWRRIERQARADRNAAEELLLRLVQSIETTAREAGARVVVAIHPDRAAFEGKEPRLLARLLSDPRLAGAERIDMRSLYGPVSRWDELLIDASGHLNVAGNRLAARALRRVLTHTRS